MPDPDRHITRTGDDYAEAMSALLPLGQAWPRDEDSVLMKVVRGLTRIWGDFEIKASVLLEKESDPRITYELLPDWERNWGLPDPCYGYAQDRNAELVRRMTIEGSQSRQFFIDVAASLGHIITITEFRVWVVGMDRCGDARVYGEVTTDEPMRNEWGQLILDPRGNPVAQGELSAWPHYGLGPAENRFYWTVHVESVTLIWFRVGPGGGQTGVDPHLRIGTFEDLECLLNRWKPAHTEIIFDYSGLYDPPSAVLSNNTVTEVAFIGTEIGVFDIINVFAGSPKYFLTNDAGGRFRIVGNKLLLAKTLDYEAASSHAIEVMVSDVNPTMGLWNFTINVIDIDETLPVITSPPTWLVPENTLLAFPLTANKAVTWSVSGGADASKFELVGTTDGSYLRWAGNIMQDYETPNDTGLNNSYVIQVRVDDLALNHALHTITFNVVNVEDESGAMVMGAFVNEGTRRQAYMDGIMMNMR